MMKKLVFCSALLAVLLMAGCGGGKPQADGKAAAGSGSGGKAVSFWHVYDSGPSKEGIDKAIADFNTANEGKIRVEALAVNFWDYWDKLSVSIAAGQEPDIFFNDLGNVGGRAITGVLLDLGPFLEKDGIDPEKHFVPQVARMGSFDGKYYAFPFEPDVRLLFYNKAILREAGYDFDANPPDWKALWAAAQKLTTYDANGNIDRLGLNVVVPMSQSYFWTWVWGNGHDFIRDGKIRVNSAEVVSDLTAWKSMIDYFGKQKLDKFGGEFGAGAADPFIVKKLAISINGNSFMSQLDRYGKDLEWGVMEVPYPKSRINWSNGFSVELSARGKHPAEAYEFAKYLVSRDVQVMLSQKARMLTANVEASASPELSSDPFWKLCADALSVTRFREFVIESPKWYEHMMKYVEQVEHGLKTPAEAMSEVQGLVDADFQKYQMIHKQ